MPDPLDQRPTPDPTILTTEALTRGLAAERDYTNAQLDVLRERLRGIDTATQLLNETVNRVPTDVTKQVGHLRELTDEKFESVGQQFKERDTRSERESRDNKVAVDAAFAAQKEAAAKQDEANSKAINKSEAATTETINKLSELFKTTTDGLADKIDDLKERIVVTDRRAGMTEGRSAGVDKSVAIFFSVIAMLVSIGSFVAILLRR